MHYKDGIEAKKFDIARGKPYNTPYEVTGVVVGLKDGESCNLYIEFTDVFDPWVLNTDKNVCVITRGDYGSIKDFVLVYRPSTNVNPVLPSKGPFARGLSGIMPVE